MYLYKLHFYNSFNSSETHSIYCPNWAHMTDEMTHLHPWNNPLQNEAQTSSLQLLIQMPGRN